MHDAETEDPLNVPTLPVTNKRMPKTSKKFGRGKTRGGDQKGARATRVPQVVTTEVIGSNPPSSSNTSVPKKKITKLQLSKQLTKSMNKRKQSEEKAERAQKKLAIATANCKTLAALAQEWRKIIVATEQTCERLVNKARTTAEAAVQDCKLLVDEAIEMSTAKSDRIITLAHNTAEKMVASITAKSDRIIKLARNRQDASFEGAFPLYVGRSHMVAFLNERLCAGVSENILQRNLFIILESSEMIAQLRLCSIFYLTIIVPMRWLASNTFKLAHRNWGEKSMGRVIDLVYDAFVAIQADGALILDYDFMMGVFGELQTELPEFSTYMTWFFEEKESNPIGSSSKEERVLSVDKGTEMLFFPTEKQNMQTNDLCSRLAAGLASCLILELEDPRKANSDYLSIKGGKYSWAEVSDAEKDACMGLKAVNDPSESVFSTFTEALSTAGRVGLDGAAGQGQARYNNDMGGAHEYMVTGRKGKGEGEDNPVLGLFHQLPEELTDSLIVTGKRHAKATRQDFNRKLRMQEEKSEQKEKLAKEKKLAASKQDFLNASYLHQQYTSPRCSTTVAEAMREFDNLKTNAARYRYLKEQILIRYVGLGWEEAYHPWSKGGYIYTPNELLRHLTMVVIPLQRTKSVPKHPPMNLPTRPSLPTLGTKASDIIDMDSQSTQQNVQLQMDAYRERERLEEEGIGDQLSELQQNSWKIFDGKKLKTSPWGIDMLCEYVDDECEPTYVWCQGKVVELVRQTDTVAVVKIEWNETCLQPGDPKVTKHVLKKSKWNPTTKDAWRTNGAWRQDLLHLIK
jgi:hypothetical protein